MPLSDYERQVLDELEHDLTPAPEWTHRAARRSAIARCVLGVLSLTLIVLGLRLADGFGVVVAVVGGGLTVAVTASAATAARRRWHPN